MSPASITWKRPSVIPGFGPALGYTLVWLTLIALLPLAALITRPISLGFDGALKQLADPRVLSALKLSFGLALAAAFVNAIFGTLLAWVLTRYRFPMRRFADALVDLPFALPTAVAGIALASLYAPDGWIGRIATELGFKIAFTPWGIFIALTFIGLPFVVRTLQPVLADLDRETEEAARTLGASRWQTLTRVVLPPLLPAVITGFALAFARAVGEYGSVIFIAGNLPGRSEIAPLLIIIKLEQFDYAGAALVGTTMLAASFLILLGLNMLQRHLTRWAEVG